mmetsp:Transcript_18135/g.36931  ORF Transcript_18135/g.36931 Transcript_18135/m.36931 type:complete len:208 (+) Transcript_18135:1-624(+)
MASAAIQHRPRQKHAYRGTAEALGPRKRSQAASRVGHMHGVFLLCTLSSCATFSMPQPPSQRAALLSPARRTTALPPRARAPVAMSLFDSLVGMVKEATREVTVQHILLPSQSDARELWVELGASGEVTRENFGEAAAARSSCGSAQKRPDKKMPQLRGMPGELTFRKGQMAPEFERVAFEAPVGEMQPPFRTQFGWHIMLVHERGD